MKNEIKKRKLLVSVFLSLLFRNTQLLGWDVSLKGKTGKQCAIASHTPPIHYGRTYRLYDLLLVTFIALFSVLSIFSSSTRSLQFSVSMFDL